ncbi:MAG: anti-sigma regulatory factor [Ferruginibacter sp.]|nr:anti-sigma regulatory factor [Cytophagales bacterium]
MIVLLSKEILAVATEPEIILFRNRTRELAIKIGMGLVNQTKLITAASELARNMIRYGGGGTVTLEVISAPKTTGVRLTFRDEGPGIADLSLAMRDGFSTGKSLGLGLPGAKRLANEFSIQSEVGKGTTVTITRWKNG